jgi:hypothetical protein
MNVIAAYASDPQPIRPIAAIVGRSAGERESGGGQSRFQSSDVHSHGELSAPCPTCGQTVSLLA